MMRRAAKESNITIFVPVGYFDTHLPGFGIYKGCCPFFPLVLSVA